MAVPLFDSGLQRLDDIVQPGVLCAFDFDGTLAPIVTDPDKASMPAGVRQRLLVLAQLAPTAVITGRALPDIRERLGFVPTYTIGNHGMEGLPGGEAQAARHAQQVQQWATALETALRTQALDPGIRIEGKKYSISVHYRLARDRDATAAQLAELLPQVAVGARVMTGKCVFNLLPPDAPNKGDAIERLMAHCGAPSALYVGDDVTDEDVFCRKSPQLLTIRVGQEKGSAAELFINHRQHIFLLLDQLIERLRRFSAQGLRA